MYMYIVYTYVCINVCVSIPMYQPVPTRSKGSPGMYLQTGALLRRSRLRTCLMLQRISQLLDFWRWHHSLHLSERSMTLDAMRPNFCILREQHEYDFPQLYRRCFAMFCLNKRCNLGVRPKPFQIEDRVSNNSPISLVLKVWATNIHSCHGGNSRCQMSEKYARPWVWKKQEKRSGKWCGISKSHASKKRQLILRRSLAGIPVWHPGDCHESIKEELLDCLCFRTCGFFWNMCPKPFSWAKNKSSEIP